MEKLLCAIRRYNLTSSMVFHAPNRLDRAGEDAKHEFKSSARWDYKEQGINKDLQVIIA